jgi:hypothetical protein
MPRLPALTAALSLVAGACSFDPSGLRSTPHASLDSGPISIGIKMDAQASDTQPAPAVDRGPAADSGNDGCAAIAACCEACRDGDCCDSCLSHGASSGRAKAEAFVNCWDQAQQSCAAQCLVYSSATCFDCMNKQCTTQVTACYGQATASTKTCSGILDCYTDCSDDGCFLRCYAQGSAAARAKMDAVVQCWVQADSGSCLVPCTSSAMSCWSCEDKACTTLEQACRDFSG